MSPTCIVPVSFYFKMFKENSQIYDASTAKFHYPRPERIRNNTIVK